MFLSMNKIFAFLGDLNMFRANSDRFPIVKFQYF